MSFFMPTPPPTLASPRSPRGFSMRVLVTGGTGFLGSHLCARLLKDGYEVTVLRRATSDLSGLVGRGVRYVVGDITDPESVSQAVESQEIVIHAAALVGYAS